jgi:hypothetical protein
MDLRRVSAATPDLWEFDNWQPAIEFRQRIRREIRNSNLSFDDAAPAAVAIVDDQPHDVFSRLKKDTIGESNIEVGRGYSVENPAARFRRNEPLAVGTADAAGIQEFVRSSRPVQVLDIDSSVINQLVPLIAIRNCGFPTWTFHGI